MLEASAPHHLNHQKPPPQADSSQPMLNLFASSPECLVFVGAVAVVGILYSLLLLVKNRYLADLESGDTEARAEPVCSQCRESTLPTCRAIYNWLFLNSARRKLLARACCGRCGARLESQTGRVRRKGFKGSGGEDGPSHRGQHFNEHPIIFSKSRDSTLVPELVAMDDTSQRGVKQQQHIGSTTTTRVLTDANGHSIKIRLASPPPQRQAQLAALHQSLCVKQQPEEPATTSCHWISSKTAPERQQQQQQQHQHQQQNLNRASFASQSSESPLISGPPGDTQLAGVSLPVCSGTPTNGISSETGDSIGSSASRTLSDRRSSSGQLTATEAEAEESHHELERKQTVYNSSNSSEFDGPNWDSRQDSSLEQQANNKTLTQGGSDDDGGGGGEQVLDADLRQANKLNMELMMMQSSPKPARSKTASQPTELAASSTSSAPGSSRRSSSVLGSLTRSSSGPSLRLLVRPVPCESVAEVATTETTRRSPGLLATLSALGRSSSTGSSGASYSGSEESTTTACSPPASGGHSPDQLYELRPLEVHNLVTKGVASKSGGSQADKDSAQRTLSGGRRASVYGLTVRLFKRQSSDEQEEDTSSQSYQELPVVRLASSGEEDQRQPLELTKLADEPESYAFLCRRGEFPVRLSLYLVSRRTGARLTLGHCFVEPGDWSMERRHSIMSPTTISPPLAAKQEDGTGNKWPALAKRLSSESSSAGSSSGELPVERSRLLALDKRSGQAQLEYRLHQTILEAIK